MNWHTLAAQLVPGGHDIVEQDNFLSGTGQVDGRPVAVIGTTDHTPIGVEIALAQARQCCTPCASIPAAADPDPGRHAGTAPAPPRRNAGH